LQTFAWWQSEGQVAAAGRTVQRVSGCQGRQSLVTVVVRWCGVRALCVGLYQRGDGWVAGRLVVGRWVVAVGIVESYLETR
jgi:hypothetical protein